MWDVAHATPFSADCSVASQTVTVSPSSPEGGARSRMWEQPRPAASSQWLTCWWSKPRRRWACASRRNSWRWGAKSTTRSRPPGATRRAASAIARRRVVEVVQHLMDDDEVEAGCLDRRAVHVALSQLVARRRRRVRGWRVPPTASSGSSRCRPLGWHEARAVGGCARCRCRGRPSCRPAPCRPLRRSPPRPRPRPHAATAPRPRSARSGRSTRGRRSPDARARWRADRGRRSSPGRRGRGTPAHRRGSRVRLRRRPGGRTPRCPRGAARPLPRRRGV